MLTNLSELKMKLFITTKSTFLEITAIYTSPKLMTVVTSSCVTSHTHVVGSYTLNALTCASSGV